MLFADIAGSTELAGELGPQWPAVLTDARALVRDAIVSAGGHVSATEGDSFFATFSGAAPAARAATEAQRALRSHPWPERVGELRFRMGLHTGEAAHTDGHYVGLEVHRASRVAAAAHGGQVLLTAATRECLGSGAPCEDVGTHRLKDFPEPQQLFQLVVHSDRSGSYFPPPRTRAAATPAAQPFELRLLGPVVAVAGDRQLPLGGSKQRSVLAMLALQRGRVVTADQLLEGLWGESAPGSAPKMIQQYVSRLRKVLRDHAPDADIVTHARGYELRIPHDATDVAVLERLLRDAAGAGDPAAATAAARAAVELVRGVPLSDLVAEPFAPREIRRLEELVLSAHELYVEGLLGERRHDDALAHLDPLIARHPLHERFRAQRMLALYRAGRQSDALDAYLAAREALVDAAGVEPGPELRALQAAILAQDPELDLPAPPELPRALASGSPVLVGRDRELAVLRERGGRAREGALELVFVGGVRGIGKTRLVAELARGWPGAVAYATGGEEHSRSLAAVERARGARAPLLFVLDDADDAAPGLLEAAALLVRSAPAAGLMAVLLHREREPPPVFGRLSGDLDAGSVTHVRLEPLTDAAVAELARLTSASPGAAPPPAALLASGGIPLHVHRAVSEWDRAQAAELLLEVADRAAARRLEQRSADVELESRLSDFGTARQRATDFELRARAVPRPQDSGLCPFRGLAAFDTAHAEYFFGRERLVAELLARVVGAGLLAVVGPSGSGKSSLVRAGLRAALAEGALPGAQEWRQVLLRPGEHPMAELGRAIPELDGARPGALLEDLGPAQRLVVIVDQFEEIFTSCLDDGERARFVDVLVALAQDDAQRAVVVLALRADFYGACAHHPDLARLMSANQVLVGPMRREELRRAIELPARRAGLHVERRLADALVAEVADAPGGLPLLSTALVELWQQREDDRLRHDAYLRSGGVRGAVGRLAEQSYATFGEPARRRARALLLRLTRVTPDGTVVRRRVRTAELGLDADPEAAAVVAALTERRLLTVDATTVEVAHEALLREWPRLRRWLEDDLAGRRIHDHLIQASASWEGGGRDAAELYRGARLAAALDWAEAHRDELSGGELAFLAAAEAESRAEERRARRANRRLRTLLAGTAALLAAAVAAGAAALDQREDALRSGTRADAERLGSQALVEDDLDRSLLLARQAVALHDSPGTRSNLLSALLRTPAAVGIRHGDGDPLEHVALSPDGRTLVTGDDDGTLTFYDAGRDGRPRGRYEGLARVSGLAFDPRGRQLAVSGRMPDGEAVVQLLDAVRRRPVRTLGGIGSREGVAIAYSGDGRTLAATFVQTDATSTGPGVLHRWRDGERTGPPVEVTRAGSPPAVLELRGDGLIVTGGPGTPTRVRDARTLRVVRTIPGPATASAMTSDGRTLALGDAAGTLRLVDLPLGRVRRALGEHGGRIGSVAFSDGGQFVVTSGDDARVLVWDSADAVIRETLGGHGGPVTGQALTGDGSTLYTASLDGNVIVWDLDGARRLGRPFIAGRAHPHAVGAAISPDGRTLAVPQPEGVSLIDTRTLGHRGRVAARSAEAVEAVAFAPDGRLVVAGAPGFLQLFDAGSGTPAGPPLMGHSAHMLAPAVARDVMVTAGSERTVRRWALPRGRPLGGPLVMDADISAVAVTPGGGRFAVGLADGSVRVHETRSGRRLATVRTGGGGVSTMLFSADGRRLFVADAEGATRIWSTTAWRREGRTMAGQAGDVVSAALSADGRLLVTGSTDGTAALWDAATQEQIGTPLPGLPNVPAGVALLPDGSALFAVHSNGRGYRWATSIDAWVRHSCTVAGRSLTRSEWRDVLGRRRFTPACRSA